ncbi:type IX secretion system protein PorG [Crocinitomix catalasitica]|uniref:type IX secretion system protein PorG n=1 Tax=Crocinitomix catalasitica TaxID=184607 RepID=UPI0006881AF9|nr:DUF6089 family protein [Crocinitomix catalasitica]
MRFFLLCCLLISQFSFSQGFKTAFEFGFFGGGTYYIGDLNPSTHFKYSKPAVGMIFRYNLTTRYSMRLTANMGDLYAADAYSDDPYAQQRNLDFKSRLYEIAFGMEFDFFKYRINDMEYPITPYFFYQFAYARINPMTNFNGVDYELQPLGTEGQGSALSDNKKLYNLNQFTIPLGIGLKFNLRSRIAMSFEYSVRKTFTDYIDDVSGSYVNGAQLSQLNGPLAADLADRSLSDSPRNSGTNRGTVVGKDWYFFYGVMITFKPFKKNICDMRGWR